MTTQTANMESIKNLHIKEFIQLLSQILENCELTRLPKIYLKVI